MSGIIGGVIIGEVGFIRVGLNTGTAISRCGVIILMGEGSFGVVILTGDGNLIVGTVGTVVGQILHYDATYLYYIVGANTISDTNWRRVTMGSAF